MEGLNNERGVFMKYQYCCVSPKSLEELNFIINNEQEITRQTFLKHVNKDELREIEQSLGYDRNFPMSKDWHVTYHKSKTPTGKRTYFFCHSAIEYVFYS
jgi:hypothetical protein